MLAVVRALRDRPARGDGMRSSGCGVRCRGADRHRCRRCHGAARAAAAPRQACARNRPPARGSGAARTPRRRRCRAGALSLRVGARGGRHARRLSRSLGGIGGCGQGSGPVSAGEQLSAHLAALTGPLAALERELVRLEDWGAYLARVLLRGGRLLAVGNGGSAAQAEHLTAELVGRYRDERPPFSALALHADSATLTAIANDFGAEEVFARQVRAHGRPGDVLLAFTTSGRSPNVVAAIETALEGGLEAWALTGPAPNPACDLAAEALCVEAATTATVQEIHQIALHLLCAAVDVALDIAPRSRAQL